MAKKPEIKIIRAKYTSKLISKGEIIAYNPHGARGKKSMPLVDAIDNGMISDEAMFNRLRVASRIPTSEIPTWEELVPAPAAAAAAAAALGLSANRPNHQPDSDFEDFEDFEDELDADEMTLTEVISEVTTAVRENIRPDVETYAADSVEAMRMSVMKEIAKAAESAAIKAVQERKPTTVEIKIKSGKKSKRKTAGLQHKQFPKLLKLISARLNVYMVGPAGSGKTRAASEAAKALDLDFYAESVCGMTPESNLKGYCTADGEYIETNFRRAFECGGVFLLDEIDAANPNVLTSLNAATAVEPGEVIAFPDGMVKRHENFICIAAANTYGRGGDRQYVGRNPLDAASVDRFVTVDWDYDESLESELAAGKGVPSEWVSTVQAIREAVAELKVRLVVSPRATFNGGAMLNAGFSESEALHDVVFKGLDSGTVNKIMERVRTRSIENAIS